MFSDTFVGTSNLKPSEVLSVSITKGLIYVLITSLLYYWLIFMAMKKLSASKLQTKKAFDELEDSNRLLSSIINSSPDIAIFSLDTNFRYTAFNKKHSEMIHDTFGIKISIGMNMLECFEWHKDFRLRTKTNINRALSGECFMFHEQYKEFGNNSNSWQVHYSPVITKAGSVIGANCISINITEIKNAEEKEKIFGYRDELTGLYNRSYYYKELLRLDKPENYPIAIIMGDVNGLKLINDSFGHHTGDQLLILSAKCIKNSCRPSDIVSRWGGDEFIILMRNTDANQAKGIIERIKGKCTSNYVNAINVDISFGYGIKEKDSQDIQEVEEVAEAYMYKRKIVESRNMRNRTIKIILETLHENMPTEKEHSIRVAKFSRKIGSAMGFSNFELRTLYLIGYLHDIGKISINPDILNKPGGLTTEETKLMMEHSESGCRIIRSSYEMSEIANAILSHHERWDGKGYPKGLKNNEIPKFSRIVAIADSYDAMVSLRIYKDNLTPEQAAEEIIKNSGKQFDPDIADVFLEKVLKLKVSKEKSKK